MEFYLSVWKIKMTSGCAIVHIYTLSVIKESSIRFSSDEHLKSLLDYTPHKSLSRVQVRTWRSIDKGVIRRLYIYRGNFSTGQKWSAWPIRNRLENSLIPIGWALSLALLQTVLFGLSKYAKFASATFGTHYCPFNNLIIFCIFSVTGEPWWIIVNGAF